VQLHFFFSEFLTFYEDGNCQRQLPALAAFESILLKQRHKIGNRYYRIKKVVVPAKDSSIELDPLTEILSGDNRTAPATGSGYSREIMPQPRVTLGATNEDLETSPYSYHYVHSN